MEVIRIILDWFGGSIVTLPLVLVFMYCVDKKRFAQKWMWVALFTLYLSAMFIIVGVPDFHYARWNSTINFIPFRDFSFANILGMVLNIAMFIPFGGFLPIYFKHFRNVKRTLFAGFAMSFSIELLQLFTPRATDVDDLIMNTIGAFVGYGIAQIVLSQSKSADTENRDIMKLLGMIMLIGVVTVFIRYPLTAFLFGLFNF